MAGVKFIAKRRAGIQIKKQMAKGKNVVSRRDDFYRGGKKTVAVPIIPQFQQYLNCLPR